MTISPESNNPERETRILDAASDLIAHYGYDKTTVSDIAHEAGISKGAIYLHFESKDALFEALLTREVLRYSEDFVNLMQADESSGTLGGMFKVTLLAMSRNPFIMALFRRDRHILGRLSRRDKGIFARRKAINEALITQMQAVGAIRDDVDAKMMAYIMSMMAYALVSMDEVLAPEDIAPVTDVIENIAWLLDSALTPADGGNPEGGRQIAMAIIEGVRQQIQSAGTIASPPTDKT